MPKQVSEQPESEKSESMVGVYFRIPKSIHKQLRVRAIEQETTLAHLLTELVYAAFDRKMPERKTPLGQRLRAEILKRAPPFIPLRDAVRVFHTTVGEIKNLLVENDLQIISTANVKTGRWHNVVCPLDVMERVHAIAETAK